MRAKPRTNAIASTKQPLLLPSCWWLESNLLLKALSCAYQLCFYLEGLPKQIYWQRS